MWVLYFLFACADFFDARGFQAELETVGDCESTDDAIALFKDADGDGYGEGSTPSHRGCLPVAGYIDAGGDCADDDETRFPGAVEQCDGVDQDCDLTVDEAPDVVWCVDDDMDGYGDGLATQVRACERPANYVEDCSDCDDGADDVNPEASELPGDGVDNDCDGSTE